MSEKNAEQRRCRVGCRATIWTVSSLPRLKLIAAFFVGLVAANTLLSRFCCVISSTFQIPDAYDFGRLLMGVLIFWGIAATSYRGAHITVDLVVGKRGAAVGSAPSTVFRMTSRGAVCLVSVQTYTLFDKVDRRTYNDNVLTFDYAAADWPHGLQWPGSATFRPFC